MEPEEPRVTSDLIRRQSKAVHDREWIVEFLAEQEAGVLGFIDPELGQDVDGDADANEGSVAIQFDSGSAENPRESELWPHLVTQLFWYDDDDIAIYFHGAADGRTFSLVDGHAPLPARFTTSRQGRYIPAEYPVNFTVEYASVVAGGQLDLVVDFEDKRRVLLEFMNKFAPHMTPGKDYEPMQEDSINRTAVYRFMIESWSAKRGMYPTDEPGAYELSEDRPKGGRRLQSN